MNTTMGNPADVPDIQINFRPNLEEFHIHFTSTLKISITMIGIPLQNFTSILLVPLKNSTSTLPIPLKNSIIMTGIP